MHGHLGLAGAATGTTAGHHVVLSLLLIVRQGWLSAASQVRRQLAGVRIVQLPCTPLMQLLQS